MAYTACRTMAAEYTMTNLDLTVVGSPNEYIRCCTGRSGDLCGGGINEVLVINLKTVIVGGI